MTYLEAVEYIDGIPLDFFRVQGISYAGIFEDTAGMYRVHVSPHDIQRWTNLVPDALDTHAPLLPRSTCAQIKHLPRNQRARSQRPPAPCTIRQHRNTGSINVFFSTSDNPSYIFGITAAHTFDQNGGQKITLNAKSLLSASIVGHIENRYDQNNIADLAILKFERSAVLEKYDLEPLMIKTPSGRDTFRIFGSKSVSDTGSLQLSHVTLSLDRHTYRKAFATRLPIASGDSGSGVFNYNFSICYGIAIARKGQFTFIQDLSSLYTLLSKEYKVYQFYYLTKKPHK